MPAMETDSDRITGKRDLLKLAEQLLLEGPEFLKDIRADDLKTLIHEFAVSQIESELQDEELRRSREEIDASRKRYYDLYDFAPVGYITIDHGGLIHDINLTGADLLGIERQHLINKRFSQFIAPESQDAFYHHRRQILESGQKETCALKLLKNDGTPVYTLMECVAAMDDKGDFTRIQAAMLDITLRKHAEKALEGDPGDRRCYEIFLGRQIPCNSCQTRLVLETKKPQTQEWELDSGRCLLLQEKERHMISLELHDTVAQDLISLKIASDLFFQEFQDSPDRIRERFLQFSQTLQKSINKLRNISYDLRPPGLEDYGIVNILNEYAHDFSRQTGLHVEFIHDGVKDQRFDYNIEINLYRLVQEGLNNIKKHAAAGHATIRFSAAYPNLILCIEDDGRGFDVEEYRKRPPREKRMGIRSMEERTTLLKGKITLESGPNKGTKVRIEIPFEGREDDR